MVKRSRKKSKARSSGRKSGKASRKSKSKARKAKSSPRRVSRKSKSRAVKRTKAKPKLAAPKKLPKPIGEVTHFYGQISVAVVKLFAPLKQGDRIRIAGHGSSSTQTVRSMQVEHEQISLAKKGQEIGMKVDKPVKENDLVYRKSA